MTVEQSQAIPVEKGWPLLGILPKLLSSDPYEYLKNIMLERGDFVQINFGPKPVYLVSHPNYLQRILRDNYQNYRKPGMLYDAARVSMGNGLVLSTGDVWLRQRRMIQPHLHRKQLVNLFNDMRDAISKVLVSWEPLAEKQTTTSLGPRMAEISSNVTMDTMFGKNLLPTDEISAIAERVLEMIKYGGEAIYGSMLPNWLHLPGEKQHLENTAVVKATVNTIVAKSRENSETSASLIQMLIHSVDEESQQQMTEQQLFDEIMTIIIAGYETTATALLWLWVTLHHHPDVLKKLHTEIDSVLAGRTPTFEDIPRLIYTRQVLMEVIRMYTIVPFLPRALNEADQLGEYSLPADALLLVFYHGVHHNPNVWDDPEVFRPERFSPEEIAKQHAFAYVPFSAGPRKCAGDEFALLEGTLAIVMILQKYDITFPPNQTFSAKLASTMHPKKDLQVLFSLRK